MAKEFPTPMWQTRSEEEQKLILRLSACIELQFQLSVERRVILKEMERFPAIQPIKGVDDLLYKAYNAAMNAQQQTHRYYQTELWHPKNKEQSRWIDRELSDPLIEKLRDPPLKKECSE